ncbi:MAG TPA: hypothetical protein PKE69_10675 [Pyrinomonadaceae bacterium]|nr:hypothetical protein [Pyrinomonadaceae bacterium]
MSNSSGKKISPNKKFYVETNGALLKIFSRETESQIHTLALNQYDLRKPEIFRWSSDSKSIGVFIARSLPEKTGDLTIYRNNYWVGIWYPFSDEFFTVYFPEKAELESNGNLIDAIEVLADERTVICFVKGKEFKRVQMPNEPMISTWQKEKRDLESVKTETPKTDKKEWTWNHNADGYEGVHLYEGQVLWFQHSHNPHAGGAASGQSFEDFLENGASCAIPSEFLKELYDAVKKLSEKK